MRVDLYPGMEKEINRLPGILPMLAATAGAVATEAKRLASSERIAREIKPDAGVDPEGPVARVNANHWTSWFVEGGTIDQAPTPYLRRALEARGL